MSVESLTLAALTLDPCLCQFINHTGEQCSIKPHKNAERCGRHKGAASHKECTHFSRCATFTRSPKGICTPCQVRLWRQMKKIREAAVAAAPALELNVVPLA